MIRAIFLALIAMSILASPLRAEEAKQAIPYKVSNTPFEEHGSRVGLVSILFLLASGGFVYYLRRKNPNIGNKLFMRNNRQLKILDRVRLNSRSTLYVIEFNQRELLIGHSGDTLVTLSELKIVPDEE